MIRVEKDAQRTDAYQESRNLMLSPTTHAVPILQASRSWRTTSAARTAPPWGQVDRDQLFYLMARGLSRGEAERLIVEASSRTCSTASARARCEALGEALEARIPQA